MGRRITNGIVGTSGAGGLGNLTVEDTTVSTAVTNDNIILDPLGTGSVLFGADAQLQARADLRFADADSSNWVAFQAAETISANVTWTLPSTDGSAGQAIVTSGAGVLSFSSVGATVTDQTVSGSTFYPLFFNATSGNATAVNVSSTKLTYQPSTGTLSSTIFSGSVTSASATITGGTINGTTIGATTAAAATFTTITETSSAALKENIKPIENALESICALTGMIYDRRDGSSKNEAGLIAEQVEKILPNMVTRDQNGQPHGLYYSKLSAYLIESIKTLKNEIDFVKSRLS